MSPTVGFVACRILWERVALWIKPFLVWIAAGFPPFVVPGELRGQNIGTLHLHGKSTPQ